MDTLNKYTYQPTIENILSLKTSNIINSNYFFKKPINEIFDFRYQLESNINKNEIEYVCEFCKQAIKIRGGGQSKKTFHFSHLKNSDECPIKSINNYTYEQINAIKYNNVKESDLHIYIKNFIADYLKKNEQIENVNIEQVIKSKRIEKEWRKPDVNANFKDKKIAFEIQLSTTFLSVINQRQIFYESNNMFIFWIFNSFEISEDRLFTKSDVFYSNNRNAFVLSETAKQKSILNNELYLEVIYEKPIKKSNQIVYEFYSNIVTLNDLIFDYEKFKIYYFDVLKEEQKIKNEIYIETSEQKKQKEIENNKTDIQKLFEKINNEDCYDYISIIYNFFAARNVGNEYENQNNNINDSFGEKWLENKYNELKLTNFNNGLGLDKILYIRMFCYLYRKHRLFYFGFIKQAKIQRLILDLLSIKEGILFCNFNNFDSFINNAMNHRIEYFDLYIKALQVYNRIENISENNKLKSRIFNYLENKPDQNNSHLEIIKIFFPKLFS